MVVYFVRCLCKSCMIRSPSGELIHQEYFGKTIGELWERTNFHNRMATSAHCMSCTEKGTTPYVNALRDSAVAKHQADYHPGQPPNYEGGILEICRTNKECQIREAYWVKEHKDGRASINRGWENNGIAENLKI